MNFFQVQTLAGGQSLSSKISGLVKKKKHNSIYIRPLTSAGQPYNYRYRTTTVEADQLDCRNERK